MSHFGALGAREVLGVKHCRGRQADRWGRQAGRGKQKAPGSEPGAVSGGGGLRRRRGPGRR